MNILLKNGTVINTDGRQKADVLITGEKIAKIEQNIKPEADTQVIDCTNLLVLPGAIDSHTHFEIPIYVGAENTPYQSADDFFTGTRAAACGAVTTIIDFVTPFSDESLMDALKKRKEAAKVKACIDYSLHMGLIKINDKTIAEMQDVVNAGVSSFKVFMTYAIRATDDEFQRALTRSRELDALIMVHAEAHEELETLRSQFIAQKKTDAWYHYLSRPEANETKAVKRAIELAVIAGAPLYIVHLACDGGMDAVEKAQLDGHVIYAETCPQYLHFTSDVYKRPDARNFVCSPPIKGQESQDALWAAVKQGDRYSVSFSRNETEYLSPCFTVATDHCPFNSSDKDYGKDDFTMIPNGVMGVENLYPYMLSKANEGQISFERAVELCSANPARIFKLSPRKGAIEAGADADIVIYDPGKNFTISQKNMHSTIDYTIWEGTKLKGYPIKTYTRGNLIYNNGEFTGKPGHGRFYPRS